MLSHILGHSTGHSPVHRTGHSPGRIPGQSWSQPGHSPGHNPGHSPGHSLVTVSTGTQHHQRSLAAHVSDVVVVDVGDGGRRHVAQLCAQSAEGGPLVRLLGPALRHRFVKPGMSTVSLDINALLPTLHRRTWHEHRRLRHQCHYAVKPGMNTVKLRHQCPSTHSTSHNLA